MSPLQIERENHTTEQIYLKLFLLKTISLEPVGVKTVNGFPNFDPVHVLQLLHQMIEVELSFNQKLLLLRFDHRGLERVPLLGLRLFSLSTSWSLFKFK